MGLVHTDCEMHSRRAQVGVHTGQSQGPSWPTWAHAGRVTASHLPCFGWHSDQRPKHPGYGGSLQRELACRGSLQRAFGSVSALALVPFWHLPTDRQTDRQTDGRTDGRTDRQA
eukprot:87137-Chlamydomonas_euryale.AAC.2